MILKTKPITNLPDFNLIKDEIVKNFGRDISDILFKTVRDAADDIAALENAERATTLPTANLERRGKFILREGTGGAADGLFMCVDTGSGGFAWKIVSLT